MQKQKNNGPLWITLGSLLWGTDSVFRKSLVNVLPTGIIVFYEHCIGSFIALPILIKKFRELLPLSWKEWLGLIFISLGGSVIATLLFTAAFSYINPSIIIVLQKLQPIITISIAYFFLKERFEIGFWKYAILALVGAYILAFDLLKNLSFNNANFRGVLFAITATVLWGCSTVVGKKLSAKISFPLLTSARVSLGFFFLFPIVIIRGYSFTITIQQFQSLLFIAIIPGVTALFLYYRGLSTTKASIASICELAFPISSIILNWYFLGATLTPYQIVGSIIILYAITMLSIQQQRNKHSPQEQFILDN